MLFIRQKSGKAENFANPRLVFMLESFEEVQSFISNMTGFSASCYTNEKRITKCDETQIINVSREK